MIELSGIFKSPIASKLLLAGGAILAIVLIIAGSLGNHSNNNENEIKKDVTLDSEKYVEALEEKLKNTLESAEGVSCATVMVMTAGGEEYNYAENSTAGGGREVVTSQNGQNGQSAVIESISLPRVTGVAVICRGGNNPSTAEKVYGIVQSLFGLPTNRIYVSS